MPLPRSRRGACSPITQRIASTTFDLPQPFGPTTPVMPGLNETTVRSTNDLKPWSSSDLSRTCPRLLPAMAPRTAGTDHSTPPARGCAMGEFGKAEGGNGLFTTAPSAQQLFSGGEPTRRPTYAPAAATGAGGSAYWSE